MAQEANCQATSFYIPMNFQRKNIEKYVQLTASSKSKMPQNKPNEGGKKEKVLHRKY